MKTPLKKTVEHRHLVKRAVRLGRSTCFLCSAPLRAKNRSDEHVIPKWLQSRFNLWDQRLDLINKTSMPYRQLVIPCCMTCNRVHLQKLETMMQSAVESGPEAVAKLPPEVLYMWLSKIFYGILFRESLLHADRKSGKRPIVSKKVLQDLRLHHDFMQGIRHSLEFPFGIPGSIFIFGTSVPDRVEKQFDFLDNHANLSIAFRMGSVGVVCCLQDGGITKACHDQLERPYYREDRLHPMQFREATAEIFYKSILLETTALYTYTETPERMQIFTLMPYNIIFREWDSLCYCTMLGHFWNQPVEEVYGGETGNASSLRDEDNKFPQLNPNVDYRMIAPSKWKAEYQQTV